MGAKYQPETIQKYESVLRDIKAGVMQAQALRNNDLHAPTFWKLRKLYASGQQPKILGQGSDPAISVHQIKMPRADAGRKRAPYKKHKVFAVEPETPKKCMLVVGTVDEIGQLLKGIV